LVTGCVTTTPERKTTNSSPTRGVRLLVKFTYTVWGKAIIVVSANEPMIFPAASISRGVTKPEACSVMAFLGT
jgi:hypothetical protein